MDPLTHTLVGANLASTRLGARSRLATAACLIGANAPDIDVTAYFAGEDFAIGFRRGWTHGLVALVVLPVVLWVLLMLWDRAGAAIAARRRGGLDVRTPVHAPWLLFLCVVSVLTHPFLDWLNVYGMRWLMPFDGRWFYGDSVFIMDPWLWLILAGLWLVPRRATVGLVIVWAMFSSLLALVVYERAPHFLPLIASIATILLIALLWKVGDAERRYRFGVIALSGAAVYVGSMIVLHERTVATVTRSASSAGVEIDELMVGPLPVDSLTWDVLIQSKDHYRFGKWSWWNRELTLTETRLPLPHSSELWDVASADPSIAGFTDWVRYPWMATEPVEGGTRVYILDARYTRSLQSGFGAESVIVKHPTTAR